MTEVYIYIQRGIYLLSLIYALHIYFVTFLIVDSYLWDGGWFMYTGQHYTHKISDINAPVNVNHALPQTDPKNSDWEKVCQNPHPAINFGCENPLQQDLYVYHL